MIGIAVFENVRILKLTEKVGIDYYLSVKTDWDIPTLEDPFIFFGTDDRFCEHITHVYRRTPERDLCERITVFGNILERQVPAKARCVRINIIRSIFFLHKSNYNVKVAHAIGQMQFLFHVVTVARSVKCNNGYALFC